MQPTSNSAAVRSGALPGVRRHWLSIAAVAVASALLSLAVLVVSRFDTFSANAPTIRAVPQKFDGDGSFGMLPAAAQLSISRALGNDVRGYWARPATGGFVSDSPHHLLSARFSSDGVGVSLSAGSLGISLAAYGEGIHHLQSAALITPSASRATVTYDRGSLREWYANGPLGLEQGLDLAAAPRAHGDGLLFFFFKLSGSLRARMSGPTVLFDNSSGHEVLQEGDLAVYDAANRLIPSSLAIAGSRLIVRVDAVGARYPLRIDPVITTPPVASGPTLSDATSNVPSAVAAAGNVVVIGDPAAGATSTVGDARAVGGAWLFVEPAAGWQSSASPTATLSPNLPPATLYGDFGTSVAITATPGGPQTVAVGDPTVTGSGGSLFGHVYVYTEPTGGWSGTLNPTADLTNSADTAGDYLGDNIAMSATTTGHATIAASTGDTFQTAGFGETKNVYVYAEPPGGWASASTPSSALAPAPISSGDAAAATGSFAITTDPSTSLTTVAVGVQDSNPNTDASTYGVELFREPSGGWSSTTGPQATLTATGTEPTEGSKNDHELAIESSATAPLETVFAGSVSTSADAGAVVLWTEPASGWASTSEATATLTPAPQTAPLTCLKTATSQCFYYYFGEHITLDSTTVIVGDDVGDLYAFAQPAGGWASASGASFAVIDGINESYSSRTYSIAGACTDVFLGDIFSEAVDVVRDPTASTLSCNPTLTVVRSGGGSGAVSTTNISCGSTCSAAFASGTSLTLTATPASGSGFAGWSGGGCTGTATCSITLTSDETVTATFEKLPVNTAPPKIAGTAAPGHKLTCSTGKWKDAETFGYGWVRDGVALYGVNSKSRTVAELDEGSTLGCQVTASNHGVSKLAGSKTVKVPIPFVQGCPGATGSLSGTRIGLIHLGMTRKQARAAYIHHSNHSKQYEDFFCLTPIGVRAGYASPKLLDTLSKSEAGKLKNRLVWASTSNPYYALRGVRVGESAATATKLLNDNAPPLHIGSNDWYLAVNPGLTLVLKVRGGAVQEVGIADSSLTQTLAQQNTLMRSFY